jgi:RimJ/RimL family protein N-acetyltransferase
MKDVPVDLTGVELTTETVRTGRLLLRPFRPQDAEPVYLACSDRETRRWLLALPDPYTLDHARAFVTEAAPAARAGGRALSNAIEVDGEFVGSCGLHFTPGRLGPELGYWIAPWSRRQGYATEATRALAEWAFAHGATRVHLFADVGNPASHGVARRAGFLEEGRVRACLQYHHGGPADALLFSRLPGD